MRSSNIEELTNKIAALQDSGRKGTWADTDDTQGSKPIVHMQAVAGLRCVVSLWIMRYHMQLYFPGILGPSLWWDVVHSWRVHIFMLLSGMMTTIQYEEGMKDPVQLTATPSYPRPGPAIGANPDYVRDLLRASHVRGQPGRSFLARVERTTGIVDATVAHWSGVHTDVSVSGQ